MYRSLIIEVCFSAAKICVWKESYTITEGEEMSQQHFMKQMEENKHNRYKGTPLYERTMIVAYIDNIERICVPSSQYAVVVHGRGEQRLSLFNLATASNVTKPLHTVEMRMPFAHSVVAVSKTRIAVTNNRQIEFYNICNEKILASTADNIDVEGYLTGLDYIDETFFFICFEYEGEFNIVQTDFRGHVLRTFNKDKDISFLFTGNHCVSYNPVTKVIYFTGESRFYQMTLEGDITQIENIYNIEDITMTETGDMYLAGQNGLYMVSYGTEDAVKFEKRHFEPFDTRTCITYEREQKKLYVACEDYISIFSTHQSDKEKMG